MTNLRASKQETNNNKVELWLCELTYAPDLKMSEPIKKHYSRTAHPVAFTLPLDLTTTRIDNCGL